MNSEYLPAAELPEPQIIPDGTGCIQHFMCRGIRCGEEGGPKFVEPLEEPVQIETTTFSNGVRRVCCIYAKDYLNTGEYQCYAYTAEKEKSKCKYA